jgi:hypothetical protein
VHLCGVKNNHSATKITNMKKIGFTIQVLTLIIALPLLTVLELNHATEKTTVKKPGTIVTVPATERSEKQS